MRFTVFEIRGGLKFVLVLIWRRKPLKRTATTTTLKALHRGRKSCEVPGHSLLKW
jgi:hypothetical protein